jgi:anti-sigma-K factor RskA
MKENPDTNMNASNERIDELLNSYIDDELTAEQQAEVERLIEKDANIAQRLRQLKKCQILVGSMPCAEAPASVLHGVKASLAGISLPGEKQPAYEEQAGKKYLLVRKVLVAAALVAFAAVLSAVFERILPVRNAPEAPIAVETSKPTARIVTDSGFSGRLELKTSSLTAVDAFIKSAIDDNGLSASFNPERRQSRRVYSLSCTKEGLNSLLTDLEDIWSELDSATLFVNTEDFGVQTVVVAVTTKQISEIAGQDNPDRLIELAKDFSVLNNIAEHLPDKEIRAAIEAGDSNLTKQWRILKPVLTGNQKEAKKPAQQAQEKQTVHLTIILDW